MSLLKDGKALEQVKRLAQRDPKSLEEAVLLGIVAGVAELGEQSIEVWLEDAQQATLDTFGGESRE